MSFPTRSGISLSSSKQVLCEDGTALELRLSSKQGLPEDKLGMKAFPSSKNHIPEDNPTNVIPDPIGNLPLVLKTGPL